MQIKRHEIAMIFVFFLICDQYIQRYLYHVAALTLDPAIFGSIEWSCLLYYVIFFMGILAIYDYIRRKSFHGWIKRSIPFILIGLAVRFVLDKAFTNVIQIESTNNKLLLPYHLYFILEWLYLIFLQFMLFFKFGKNIICFPPKPIPISVIVLSVLIVVSILVYWSEALNLELFRRSDFFNIELSESGKQTVFNAIQRKIFTIIICPSLLILFFKFTNQKSEGGESG